MCDLCSDHHRGTKTLAHKLKNFTLPTIHTVKKYPVYLRLPWLGTPSVGLQNKIKDNVEKCFFAVEQRVFTSCPLLPAIKEDVLPASLLSNEVYNFSCHCDSGGGGFTRPIPRDGGADQFRGIPIVGRLPTDGTRGPEEKGCGRKWPDAEGLVQGSRARDVRDPVVQNHSCCKKESRLDQPCGDKS